MLNYWPSVSLYLVLVLVLLELRVVGGRSTLPFSRFLTFFTVGSVGSAVLALVLQRVAFISLDPKTVSWFVGPPIEEVAKAAGVLAFIYILQDWRRLTIADLTLMGLAAGLGFQFVESNLSLHAGNGLKVAYPYFAEYNSWGTPDYIVRSAGHGFYTAIVCLAAAIAVRLWRRPWVSWILPAFAFCLVTFDHAMYNWKFAHSEWFFGACQSIDLAAPWAEELYEYTFHGGIECVLLPVALLAASWGESRMCWAAIGKDARVLLPNETRPRAYVEWLIALDRIRLGRRPFFEILEYFRLRRAYLLAKLEATRSPDDPTLASHAEYLGRRTIEQRTVLEHPVSSAWLPPADDVKASVALWAKRMRWVLLGLALVDIFFMISAKVLPDAVVKLLFGKPMAFAMTAFSIAFVAWRVLRFRKQPKPDPVHDLRGAMVGYHAQAMLLGIAIGTTTVAVLTFFFDANALMPAVAAAFIAEPTRHWFEVIPEPAPPLQGGSILAASNPEPKSPKDFEEEAARIEKEFEELQKQLRNEVEKQLAAIAKFNTVYDGQWADAMHALDDYRNTSRNLVPDLQKIADTIGDRAFAEKVANFADGLLQLAAAAAPMLAAETAAAKGGLALSRAAALEEELAAGAKGATKIGEAAEEAAELARGGKVALGSEGDAAALRAGAEGEKGGVEAGEIGYKEREAKEVLADDKAGRAAGRAKLEEDLKDFMPGGKSRQPGDPTLERAVQNRGVRPDSPQRELQKGMTRGTEEHGQDFTWTEPNTIQEKMAMEQAKAGMGEDAMGHDVLKDPRYSDPGWIKRKLVVEPTADGNKIEIHYMKNTRTGATEQFKFRQQGEITKPPLEHDITPTGIPRPPKPPKGPKGP